MTSQARESSELLHSLTLPFPCPQSYQHAPFDSLTLSAPADPQTLTRIILSTNEH